MSPPTNTCSVSIKNLTISTEATTIPTFTSPYITQTEFSTTITTTTKDLIAIFNDKHAKKYANFKDTIEETITEKYAKFDTKFENQFQNLSLQIK